MEHTASKRRTSTISLYSKYSETEGLPLADPEQASGWSERTDPPMKALQFGVARPPALRGLWARDHQSCAQPPTPPAAGPGTNPSPAACDLPDEAMLPEGEERIRRDDYMIEDIDPYQLATTDQPPGRVSVIGRRRAVTGRMVVNDHDCRTGAG